MIASAVRNLPVSMDGANSRLWIACTMIDGCFDEDKS